MTSNIYILFNYVAGLPIYTVKKPNIHSLFGRFHNQLQRNAK